MVVTNRYFTSAARRLANANGVELWDRDKLVAVLLTAA
jgi:HJR/Mrr/RecB family endonuclease